MELWDIIDRDGNFTGRTMVRGQPLKEGDYHLVVHIWVADDENRFLIQKRADHLQIMPGMWATTGGSALAGEDSLITARRELREELGLEVPPVDFRKLFRVERRDNLADIWLVRRNVPVHEVKLQAEEVNSVRYANREEIQAMVAAGCFADYGADYFARLFASF